MSTQTELPGTSDLLYGIHEPCPTDVMSQGWIVFLVEVGHGPDPHPGIDFSAWELQGYGILCRVQHAFGTGGTFPQPNYLDAYVQRVRTLVQNSQFCHRWIIGNEPNVPVEWPDGMNLSPQYSALCYGKCWTAIHDLPGHEFDEVLLPPIGPWNAEIGIGWLDYFRQTIDHCEFIDGFALHAYTHGPNPALVTSEAKMDPPYDDCRYNFRVYRDWISTIPAEHQHLPLYITETNQYGPWLDEKNGWVPEAYREIDQWNRDGGQTIRALCLYRYPKYDGYYIDGKKQAIADFQTAQEYGYTWVTQPPPVAGRTLEMVAVLVGEDGEYEGVFEGTLKEVVT